LNVKTASLKTLAKTGAEGLQRLLRIGADWLEAVADEVVITANTSFSDTQYTADDILKFSVMVQSGSMSKEAFHSILKKQELETVEFDDWMTMLETEVMTGEL
jgi:hypothetical protein